MQIDIMTLFPAMCETYLGESIIGRAIKKGALDVRCHNIRDYTLNKQKQTDDAPFGGGMGMVFPGYMRTEGNAPAPDLHEPVRQGPDAAESQRALRDGEHMHTLRSL